MVEDDAVALARLVQAAALDPAQWEPAMNAVNTFVGGAGAVLLSVEARQRFSPFSTDLGELMEDYFAGGWFKADRRDAGVPLMRSKGIVFEQEFLSVDDIEYCDYYQDFLRRHKRKWFAGICASVDGDDWCLALQRSPSLGPFTHEDGARLHFLRRLLVDAAAISKHVGEAWGLGLQHALSAMTQPALVFDARARVVCLNEAAGLQLGATVDKDRTISFLHPRSTAIFHQLLSEANASLGRLNSRLKRTIDMDGRLYECQATTLLDQERLLGGQAAVLVLMKPLLQDLRKMLKAAYKLTEAELGIALALADGQSVQEISVRNEIKAGTVRTHLKSIYSKANIFRQSQLVALVRELESKLAQR